jgi:hypothetical protein
MRNSRLGNIIFSLVSLGLILTLGLGCQTHDNQLASTPEPKAEVSGLSSDEVATLNSLERVDKYPLYIMHYQGAYSPEVGNLPITDPGAAWACSLFTALGDKENELFGRNFDWQYSPAVLLFTDPPDGYASVSMVDLTYLGFDDGMVNIAELPLAKRQALLQAPYLPFDGMNAYGLAIAMAAVPESKMPQDANKPSIGSLAVMREVLDHARTVDEAVSIFGKYNINWDGGTALHYLIADSGGEEHQSAKAVLVEFYNGEMVIIPNDTPWHLATNHLRVTSQGDGGCDRYAKMYQRISGGDGMIALPDAMQLLADVSQPGAYPTQWSVIYDISTGGIEVVMGRAYEQPYTFQFP